MTSTVAPLVPDYDESDPLVQQMRDRAPVQLADAIATFAEAVGLVERLARTGDAALVNQLATFAYGRARRMAADR
jgi:hypothetical protein